MIGQEIRPEHKYEVSHVKINIRIGSSHVRCKLINLHYFPDEIPFTAILTPSRYDENFTLI